MDKDHFTEDRSLKYQFTPDERAELSLQLANKNQNLGSLEDEKKSVNSNYSSRINETKEQINQLSNKVSAGYELRNVNLEVQYHVPKEGEKTLIRTDIDDSRDGMNKSWVEKMTPMDYNLWTQYQEDHAEGIEEEEEVGDPNERIESSREEEAVVIGEESPVKDFTADNGESF